MATHFPPLQDDQLFMDGVGQYRRLMQYKDKISTVHDLFGRNTSRVAYDFPTSLSYFKAILPPNYSYSEDDLIDKFTLLLFFRFLYPLSDYNLLVKQ